MSSLLLVDGYLFNNIIVSCIDSLELFLDGWKGLRSLFEYYREEMAYKYFFNVVT